MYFNNINSNKNSLFIYLFDTLFKCVNKLVYFWQFDTLWNNNNNTTGTFTLNKNVTLLPTQE